MCSLFGKSTTILWFEVGSMLFTCELSQYQTVSKRVRIGNEDAVKLLKSYIKVLFSRICFNLFSPVLKRTEIKVIESTFRQSMDFTKFE